VKALILDGAEALRDMGDSVLAALAPQLEARGYSVTRRDLSRLEIPDCRGDFGCWTVTPGVCVQRGPHQDLARELIQSDLVVWLTPVTFGGYSSALKRLLDHCIPLISPLMTTVDGETHHVPRYQHFPSVLAVGLLETLEPGLARVFERVVRRNVLNMHAQRWASPVLARGELPQVAPLASRWLEDLAASRAPRAAAEPLEVGAARDLPESAPRRALLLVGSPRGRASVSAAIATHLQALLCERGLSVATELLHDWRRKDPTLRGLATRLDEADLVALATPLYVDALPAPLTEALELLARGRERASRRARFLAIVNCGFPEAVHTETALAICRAFAQQASLDWIGGLGVGGGGMLAGKPLAELGGRARFVTRALELTAEAVAAGEVVPDEARRVAGKLPIPALIYRLIADWGFREEARRRTAAQRLGDRPYAE
jgi:multimeric flavodoxin WrbA